MLAAIETYKELAIARIRVHCAGHANGAKLVFIVREFGIQLLPRATHAGAIRITRLRHKAGNDAVENHPVIETAIGKFGNTGNMVWRQIGKHPDLYLPFGCVEKQRWSAVSICRIGHDKKTGSQ